MFTSLTILSLFVFQIVRCIQIQIISPQPNQRFIADTLTGVASVNVSLKFVDLPNKNSIEYSNLICCVQLKGGSGSCNKAGELALPMLSFSLERLIPSNKHVLEVTLFAQSTLLTHEYSAFRVSHHRKNTSKNNHEIEMSILDTQATVNIGNVSVWRGAIAEREEGPVCREKMEEGGGSSIKTEVNDSTLRGLYFNSVYKSRIWSNGGERSGSDSGQGSSLKQTENIRHHLMQIIQNYNISSILDFPCGDLFWMKHVIFPSNNFQYVGADISPFLINQNRKKYPNLTFYVADIVDGSEFLNIKMKNDNVSDLIFIRHLSWHLPVIDNLKMLKRLSKIGPKYIMLSTHLRADLNEASFIPALGHPTNLFRSPYCLKDPLLLLNDGGSDVFIGLWKMNDGIPLQNENCMGDLYRNVDYPYLHKGGKK